MNRKINVFIPAAGFGERLRPVTNHIPKPLMPVLGKPVLQNVLERVSALPVNRTGLNLHHKKEMIADWIQKSMFSDTATLFYEEEVLGTGGALKNAERLLGEGTFLVHNSDILSDIDLGKLVEHHASSRNLVTLAVHDHPRFNNVIVDRDGYLKGIKADFSSHVAKEGGLVAFTGIAVYEPDILGFLPPGTSSIVEAWIRAVNAGHRIGTFDVSGCYWSDIGTPEAYARAVFDALKADGETVYIHPSVKGCSDLQVHGYVVIEEGCVIGGEGMFQGPPQLRNCILLPFALTGEGHHGTLVENCIIGPGYRVDIIETEVLGSGPEDGRSMIGSGGSDRKYFRVKRGKGTAILMECRRDDPDFTRQMEYTKFFVDHDVPVPGLIEVDPSERTAVLEDAGDVSLYNWLKCPRSVTETEEVYKKVIDELARIHIHVTNYVAACPLLKGRLFDQEYFRWETDYFIERFVYGIRSMETGGISGLGDDLDGLAFRADSFSKTIIHRDFQSQNIMIRPDGRLLIIDYQGARMGPPAYDVASLLWDPYYRLDDGLRERLVDWYIRRIEDNLDADYFRETLTVCRLQRHMQALGAYGFLSSVKKKRYFMKYIPEGLRLLKEDAELVKDEYPSLYELIMKL